MSIGISNFNTITDNTFNSNKEDGIYLVSHFNIINDNTITLNNDDGIFLAGIGNTFSGNTVVSNSDDGIVLQGTSNTIKGNNIISNSDDGIYVIGEFLLDGCFNYILKNNFIDNKRHAFFDTVILNHWANNYWDEAELNIYRINGMMSFYITDFWGEIIWELHIPWINIDWHPAKEPYDITTTQGCGIE